MRRVLLLTAFLCLGLVAIHAPKAHALSGGDWQAGRIIDDSVFFNGTSMSTSNVQAFLNSKVPACDTNGAKPYGGGTRADYGTSKGYPPPYTCLKDYSQNTPNRNAEAGLCNQYWGGQKTAAQIINDVGQACGVNPKTLIVLLEKEQSLITDDWPWGVQYGSATGFGCPDTAPCDPQFGAFFDQVYYAARQFKRYERDATLFRYRADRDNYIQWHPNAGCGGTNVFIQNQATAGLYNYTPYQPNATALSNIYGGQNDGCSSYGNRNFWRLFNDWFGGVNGPAYAWQPISISAYTDPGRTQLQSSVATLQPGAKLYMRVKARNNGYLPWNPSFMNIGTRSPQDRASIFSDSSWLNPARPARVIETNVAPSGTGTFEFTITAPNSPGNYREYFGLVAEGYTWLNDVGSYMNINVVNPVSAPSPPVINLNSGSELKPKEYLLSPEGQAQLILQTDGNLVLYQDFRAVWQSGTSGYKAKNLIMQPDGNLVLYDINNRPIWNSETYSNPGARLALQLDGHLVIYSASNSPLWSTGTVHNPNYLSYVNTTLHPGMLYPGQQLQTADRRYRFVLQKDGNLVLYSPTKAVWAAGLDGKQSAYLAMQTDGNLVVYDVNNKPIWNSGTSGRGMSALVAQGDGNLVIYDGIGRPTWNTQTAGAQ